MELRENPLPFRVWGPENIDDQSIKQMNGAMRLPVTVAGVLMPDAHVGYGIPIGGVLATEGAIIPYAVGVDIACRMRLSIFAESPAILDQQAGKFEKALVENTVFGAGGESNAGIDHDVLDDPDWESSKYVASLKDKAFAQLGTSGSGNHFVEWGSFTLEDDDLGMEAGTYLALLSHSGSRGPGFMIANHYSKLAMDLHSDLDKQVRHLAWLSLDSELGQEYWAAMELAGRFASANHYVIHQQVAKSAGVKPLMVVENHHNFAWKETLPGGQEVIVHRKGATPAGPGVLGVIPGSMGDPGFVVRGKGSPESIHSAAHGAGRTLSRTAALKSITKTERDRYLKDRGVRLIGGDMDEAPQAYKDIHAVMAAQEDLVEVVGRFDPMVVQMDDSSKKKKRTGRKPDKSGRGKSKGRR